MDAERRVHDEWVEVGGGLPLGGASDVVLEDSDESSLIAVERVCVIFDVSVDTTLPLVLSTNSRRRYWRQPRLLVSQLVAGLGEAAEDEEVEVQQWLGGMAARCVLKLRIKTPL